MRITFITQLYHPHIGGIEYVVKSVSERLAKMGHEVTVVAGEPGAEASYEEEVNGVRVVRWPTWSPRGAYHFPMKRGDLKRTLMKLLRGVNVVHVHGVHSIFTVSTGLMALDSAHDVKIVVTPHYHGTGHTTLRRLLWLVWRHKVSELLNRAHVVHIVSGSERTLVLKHYPHVKEKVIVIPNGVDEDVCSYKWYGQNSDYMVYAGRVEKYKRLELAVNVAKEMELKLLIIGRGSYRDRLKRYAEKVYKGGVEFLEPQPREKYLELLSQAKYAINPSRHEAFSVFIAEALAIGTPAIVSKEIAENLEAQVKPLNNNLVLADKAFIRTWNEAVYRYLIIYTRKNL
ncbi:glycosyltransferase family 4 protein [Thermosphaera sp.]